MRTALLFLLLSISILITPVCGVSDVERISYIGKEAPQAAQLHIYVTDEKNNALPCCLSLIDSNGNALWGLDALGKPFTYRGEPRMWISGDTVIGVTAGEYRYVISRPYRYKIASGTVSLQAGKTQSIKKPLECIIGLPRFGWFGGDAHQHIVHGEKEFAVNLETASRIARAEGGDWSSFNSYWSSVPSENPTLDELRARAETLSDDRYSAFIGDEYPKDHLGHMAFLAGPVQDWKTQIGVNEYSYPLGQHEEYAHFEIMKHVSELGGLSIYTHPVREWGGTEDSPGNIARELPFDLLAAPQLVSSVDWMTDNPDGKSEMDLWAMYLNWGYKVGICAFTDSCYDRKDARPFNKRTYVYLGAKYPNAANIIDAIKRGRTYGTSGPLMRVNVDGLPPGSVFPANYKPVTLSIDAFAPGMDYMRRESEPTLDRIEIICNGYIYETVKLKARDVSMHRMSLQIRENKDAWYIVKVYATGEKQAAISSPFYFRKIYTHPDVFPHPKPVRASVRGTVTGAGTDKKLNAGIELIAYEKNGGKITERLPAKDGDFAFDCLPTVRLRATADGYKPQTKSILFDTPIYEKLILPLHRKDQLDPAYYTKIRNALRDLKIDFTLQPK